MTKKSRYEFKYLENDKSFLDEIKVFLAIFRGLLLKQIKQIFLEGESPTLIKTRYDCYFLLLKAPF